MALFNKLSVTNFTASTIPDDFLKDFAHHQKITRKWVRTDAGWELEDASILREWDAEKESGLQDICGKNSERRDGNGGFFTRRSAGRLLLRRRRSCG